MPGPSPKPDALRARTNKESQSLELVGDPDREVPPLPEERDWLPEVRDLWATIWTSGVAAMYVAADRAALDRYITLADDFYRTENWNERTAISAEMRQLEKALGLNPEARVKLRWLVVEADAALKRSEGDPKPREVSSNRDILWQT